VVSTGYTVEVEVVVVVVGATTGAASGAVSAKPRKLPNSSKIGVPSPVGSIPAKAEVVAMAESGS